MNLTLKTNRSSVLYTVFTVLIRLLPVILIVVYLGRLSSFISDFTGGGIPGGGGSGWESFMEHEGSGSGNMMFLGTTPSVSVKEGIGDLLRELLLPLIIAAVVWLAYQIYQIILFSGVFRDANQICGEAKKSLPYFVVCLLSVITLGIYGIYWSRQQGKRLEEAAAGYQLRLRGSGTSHTVFSVLYEVPLWISIILSVMEENNSLFFLQHIGLCIALTVICFILKFMVIGNMSPFIKDVNALAYAYNGQAAYGTNHAGDSGQGYAAGSEAGYTPQPGYGPNGGDSDYTVPVEEWSPNGGAAFAQNGQNIRQSGCMVCCKGMYEGAEFPVEGEMVIGRDELSANIVIKNPGVSRKHCGVRYNPMNGTYDVTDYSSNGLFYKNGQAFPKNVPVSCDAGTILVIAQSGNEFLLK